MATCTITMSADGSFRLNPPVVIITPNDQGITWILTGAGWDWVSPGIVCETAPTNPAYTAWPAAQPTLNTTTNRYTGNANSPNSTNDWIFYKWTFSVQKSGGGTVTVDPDIGNQPEP